MNEQYDTTEIAGLTPEQESFWHSKVMELVKRHNLGYLSNPGGGQFLNNQMYPEINIQVCDWDNKEVYDGLIAGLRKLNLEPLETNQHRAIPEQLQAPKKWSANTMPVDMVDCVKELRSRIEALEATQHAHEIPSFAVSDKLQAHHQAKLSRLHQLRIFSAEEGAPIVVPISPAEPGGATSAEANEVP